MKVTRYPEVTTYVTGTAADAEAIARAARKDVAEGRAVNIFFTSAGATSLVSRVMRNGDTYHVGHPQRPATKHEDADRAVSAAVVELERREHETTHPKPERVGRAQ